MSRSWSDGIGATSGGGRDGVGNNFLYIPMNQSPTTQLVTFHDPSPGRPHAENVCRFSSADYSLVQYDSPTHDNSLLCPPWESGPELSRCRRSAHSGCPSMNRSRTICSWIRGSISTNALRASVSSSMAKIDGSSPGRRNAL